MHTIDLKHFSKKKTLWVVLFLNIAIAIGFLATGIFGDSNALIANGLDNSSDAIVYAISIFALDRSSKWKQIAANFSGIMLLVFAVGVLVDAGRRFLTGSEPLGSLMIIMSIIAAVVNLASYLLLKQLKTKDLDMRAAVTFSFNDFISNGGILISGIIVLWTGQNWPDLIVGIGVGGIAIYGGIDILRDARKEKHKGLSSNNRG